MSFVKSLIKAAVSLIRLLFVMPRAFEPRGTNFHSL